MYPIRVGVRDRTPWWLWQCPQRNSQWMLLQSPDHQRNYGGRLPTAPLKSRPGLPLKIVHNNIDLSLVLYLIRYPTVLNQHLRIPFILFCVVIVLLKCYLSESRVCLRILRYSVCRIAPISIPIFHFSSAKFKKYFYIDEYLLFHMSLFIILIKKLWHIVPLSTLQKKCYQNRSKFK